MDLTIIIVNWNTAELLLQCLESIYQAEIKLIYEIIVVDNGSTDNSISTISKKFPGVRIISNNRNLGFAKANNQGISEGKGRYFLLLKWIGWGEHVCWFDLKPSWKLECWMKITSCIPKKQIGVFG